LTSSAPAILVTNLATKDNTLYQLKAGDTQWTSDGAGFAVFASNTDAKGGEPGLSRRAVIAFTNLHNAVPAGATINNVTLRLFLNRTRETAGVPVTVHRLRSNWGEGTSNANGEEGKGATATAGDATWQHRYFNTNLWTTPGGDYVTNWSGSNIVANLSGAGQYYYWSSPQMIADVQLWLANPATNFGWIVIGKERDGVNIAKMTAKRFASREDTYPTNRPAVIIDYTVAQPVGACYLPGGGCSSTTSNQCVSLGGTWAGAGTICPPPTGACCLPSGDCTNTTAATCTSLGGTYQGDGVACTSNLCPVVLTPFVDAMPIPPVATPVSGTIGGVATYDIYMQQFTNKAHRDLPATTFWGYNGVTPGPIIIASNGAPVTVRYLNDLRDANGNYRTNHYLPVDTCVEGADVHGALPRTVVHLHGGRVPPESDGWPTATILPGEEVTYVYPNDAHAAMVWFHDHALGLTRLNVYMGLAGAYVIRDAAEAALGLPAGEFEVPLAIQDRKFNPDGTLSYPATWQQDFFGDKMMVNGKVWPYHNVKRGKYRFRILNGCNSRTLALGFSNGMNFQQIGTDGGLLAAPVTTNLIYLGPGERADAIVDFQGQSVGTQITLTNGAPAPYPGTPGVGVLPDVMQFRVVSGSAFTGPVPGALVPIVPLSTNDAVAERWLELYKVSDPCTGERWTINGGGFSDAITEMPTLGDTEIWSFVNKSGMSHPMHIHLVLFQILDRQAFQLIGNSVVPTGPRLPPPPTEAGWKDTVQVNPLEITRVIAKFDGYTGEYPYHCHILEHEENDMMRRFLVLPPPPPVITCASNQTVACGSTWAFTTPTATSSCGTNTISILSTVTNAACGGSFVATRTWRVTDACGSTNQCSQSITVADTTPPVITCAGDKTVESGQPWSFDLPTAADACGTNSITVLSTITNSPAPTTNLITRTWLATDACGNASPCSQTVTVYGRPPTIATQPQTQSVPVGADVTLFVDTAGTVPLAHQWRVGESPLLGQTATNLTLLNFQWPNVGGYDVVVTNAFGAITSSVATLGIWYPETTLAYGWNSNWLTLQWVGTNWQLLGSTNLNGWLPYPGAPTLFGPTSTVALATTNSGQYFRLQRE
jgi:spore coat protein A